MPCAAAVISAVLLSSRPLIFAFARKERQDNLIAFSPQEFDRPGALVRREPEDAGGRHSVRLENKERSDYVFLRYGIQRPPLVGGGRL